MQHFLLSTTAKWKSFTFMITLSLRLSFKPAWSNHYDHVDDKNDFDDEDSADVDEENDDDRYWDCKM